MVKRPGMLDKKWLENPECQMFPLLHFGKYPAIYHDAWIFSTRSIYPWKKRQARNHIIFQHIELLLFSLSCCFHSRFRSPCSQFRFSPCFAALAYCFLLHCNGVLHAVLFPYKYFSTAGALVQFLSGYRMVRWNRNHSRLQYLPWLRTKDILIKWLCLFLHWMFSGLCNLWKRFRKDCFLCIQRRTEQKSFWTNYCSVGKYHTNW